MKILLFFRFHPLLFMVLIVWGLVWKGLALWKSARQDEQAWFIVLLIVNTLGILDILYLYAFSKQDSKQVIEK